MPVSASASASASVPAPASAPARLWLVRHAQPLVAPGVCYGRLDLPADAAATAASAQALAAALPASVRLAHHSPLQRCEQLAQALQALRPGLALKPEARLQELDFGTWEGCAWDAIGRAPVHAWTADFAHHRPGGGESLAHMLGRVAAALAAARLQCDSAAATAGGSRDVLWITHAGVARCVQWLLEQSQHQHQHQHQHPRQHSAGDGGGGAPLPRADQWPLAAPKWGAWQVVELGPQGG